MAIECEKMNFIFALLVICVCVCVFCCCSWVFVSHFCAFFCVWSAIWVRRNRFLADCQHMVGRWSNSSVFFRFLRAQRRPDSLGSGVWTRGLALPVVLVAGRTCGHIWGQLVGKKEPNTNAAEFSSDEFLVAICDLHLVHFMIDFFFDCRLVFKYRRKIDELINIYDVLCGTKVVFSVRISENIFPK